MRSVTLGTLVTRCQQRADRENDDHIGTSEWKSLISEKYGELHGVVVNAGMRYYETEATITATGASTYTLPADHLATIGIDFVMDAAGRRRELTEIMVQERTRVIGETGDAYYYTIIGQTIVFYPNPASGSYRHLYIPQAADLGSSADGTSVDVVTPDGEAFLIWAVAVPALNKSEAEVRVAMAERDAARARLEAWAQQRAFNQPRRIVRGRDVELAEQEAGDWRWR